MNGETINQGVDGVSGTIAGWLEDVARLLRCVQVVLENSQPAQGAPAEIGALINKLTPLVRECRSQIPSDQVVEVWVRTVAEGRYSAANGLDLPAAPRQSQRGQSQRGRKSREAVPI